MTPKETRKSPERLFIKPDAAEFISNRSKSTVWVATNPDVYPDGVSYTRTDLLPETEVNGVTEKSGWVRSVERLPDERMLECMCFNGDAPEYNQHVFRGCWFNDSKSFALKGHTFMGTITHWMPLPAPPINK